MPCADFRIEQVLWRTEWINRISQFSPMCIFKHVHVFGVILYQHICSDAVVAWIDHGPICMIPVMLYHAWQSLIDW